MDRRLTRRKQPELVIELRSIKGNGLCLRRASTPCPQARIRTSQNGGVTSAYCAASVRRGFLVCQSGVSNLQCDPMTCNALHYAASRTLSHRQASCLRRIARATGRPHRWCASMPWSSGSRPCCGRSISCNLLCKTSMAHSVMSRKSALIGSHRCRDNPPVAGRVTQRPYLRYDDGRLVSSGS